MITRSAAIFLCVLIYGCGDKAPKGALPGAEKQVCIDSVKSRLRAPATARFAPFNEIVTTPVRDQLAIELLATNMSTASREFQPWRSLNEDTQFMTYSEESSAATHFKWYRIQQGQMIIKSALVRWMSGGDVVVRGWVDAQNAFGAMLRGSFICVVGTNGAAPDMRGLMFLNG